MSLPSTEVQLGFNRLFGAVNAGALAQYIPTMGVIGTGLGGFYAQPFRLPLDFDRSRVALLFGYIATVNAPVALGGNVKLDLGIAIAAPNSTATFALTSQLVAIPAAWPTNSWMPMELTVAGGPALPASSLTQSSVLGFRLARDGPAPGDVWTGTLQLITLLVLRYSRLCQFCECP